MPLEANLFYGGQTSPTPARGAANARRRVAAITGDSPSTSTALATPTLSSTNAPSQYHTTRIPPPPSSPSPRRRGGGGGPRRASSTSSSSSPSKVSPAKFKLHFQGRVYRPFSATSPPNARKLYSPSKGLLGQPDELVQDADAIIDCLCSKNVDDSSLMLQCEECEIWLHARCVGFQYEEECPAEYFCRKCAPSSSATKNTTTTTNHTENASTRKTYERQSTPEPKTTSSSLKSRSSSPVRTESEEEDIGLEIEHNTPLTSSPLARTPTRISPSKRTPQSPSQYSISRNLLSDFANASPIIKASPSHPLLTPSKRSKRAQDSDTEVLIATAGSEDANKATRTPPKRVRVSDEQHATTSSSSLHPMTVPLPEHYTALLNLHAAVERALLLHLATEGARACSAAVASSDGTKSTNGMDNLVVDLPNLATFTGIRAVVERGSGRRFGPTELAQLVWLWEGGLGGPRASEQAGDIVEFGYMQSEREGRRGGLSMTVSSTREMDKISGKKAYTWGIGINLQLKQNIQLPALELVDATSSTSSPSSSTSVSTSSNDHLATPPATSVKRYGLSVLPLWSSKAEYRRQEMRRRLGECVLKAHDNFSGGTGSSYSSLPSSSPSNKRDRLSGAFNQPGLPPTPPPSNRKKSSIMAGPSSNGLTKGFILDALPPIPAATLPPLGPATILPVSVPVAINTGIANADMADILRADHKAMMPHTGDTSGKPARSHPGADERKTALLDGQKSDVKKAPFEQRAMSLLDRIKAKEAAQQAANASQAPDNALSMAGRKLSKNENRSVALMSLEAASARAKKKANQKAL